MQLNDQQVTFNVLNIVKSFDDVEDCNFISFEDFTIAEQVNSCCRNEEIKAVTFEELEDEDPEAANITWLGEKQSFRTDKHFESLDLSNREVKPSVLSIKSPSILELKLLPSHLKYAYLDDNDTLFVIISSS